jgi:hypothetical protein
MFQSLRQQEELMARILCAIILLSSVSLFAQDGKPNPNDYTVNVHVQSSRLGQYCTAGDGTSCQMVQRLKVIIDGRKYELVGRFGFLDKGFALLRTGDYKARISKDNTPRPHEYLRFYEFLFADGHKREYMVVGESE